MFEAKQTEAEDEYFEKGSVAKSVERLGGVGESLRAVLSVV